jgi:RNA polymerase sigma factor (sigma-70 family)
VAGSQEAWRALIDKYRRLIFSIPIKLGFSRDDAADVFQEVCLKLLRELPRLREPRTLPAWLITVTSHECLRWWSKSEHRRRIESSSDQVRFDATLESSPALAEEVQREQALREAVLELEGRCRDLVEMLFYATPLIPYQDAAKKLGLAVGSIGFIRRRCLERLRGLLEQKGFH